MLPVSLAEVPSLHRFTQYWGHEFSSSDERGLMLRLRELLKHASIREPIILSSTCKSQVRIGSGETGCTPWVVVQH